MDRKPENEQKQAPETRDDETAGETRENPAEDPGPRGNEEIDEERMKRAEEDLDRTLPG